MYEYWPSPHDHVDESQHEVPFSWLIKGYLRGKRAHHFVILWHSAKTNTLIPLQGWAPACRQQQTVDFSGNTVFSTQGGVGHDKACEINLIDKSSAPDLCLCFASLLRKLEHSIHQWKTIFIISYNEFWGKQIPADPLVHSVGLQQEKTHESHESHEQKAGLGFDWRSNWNVHRRTVPLPSTSAC